MKTDLVIARLDTALVALKKAMTIRDIKQVLDIATASELYAKRQPLT